MWLVWPAGRRARQHDLDTPVARQFPVTMPLMDKPHAPATDRNREPILAVLRERFADRHSVLEIGSGTGQHAVYFARALPWLRWQTSDVAVNLPGIRQWLDEAVLPNTPAPLTLDLRQPWPAVEFDAVFSANTLHIMGWPEVQQLFQALGRRMPADGPLTVYGPFNYGGRFTSESNAGFDASLRAGNPASGLRDFEAVDTLAKQAGLRLIEDRAMPANNRCITWQRTSVGGG
jgi:cyclopropane fatty-acyl-phospholipid synthase-like methyltransferase